jgi:hypothetical protein
MEIITHLFRLIAENDREAMRIVFGWIRDVSHSELVAEAPACV